MLALTARHIYSDSRGYQEFFELSPEEMEEKLLYCSNQLMKDTWLNSIVQVHTYRFIRNELLRLDTCTRMTHCNRHRYSYSSTGRSFAQNTISSCASN